MARNGKRYRAALEAIDRQRTYPVDDGLKLLKGLPPARFDETVEIAVRVTIRGNQTVRDTMVLPHSFEQEQRILVFAEGDKATEAEEAGATYVGGQDLIDKIKDGWLEFDVTVATPDMMRNVGRLGPILGRRGLMPNPKTRTVTQDVAGTIAELKRGRVEFRADRTGVVHLPIGKLSMDAQELAENARSVVAEVERKRPADTKGDFLRSVAVCTTMSPGVKVTV
jgi:large subunit ribosomal protein L1